jgi:hypothetical protein
MNKITLIIKEKFKFSLNTKYLFFDFQKFKIRPRRIFIASMRQVQRQHGLWTPDGLRQVPQRPALRRRSPCLHRARPARPAFAVLVNGPNLGRAQERGPLHRGSGGHRRTFHPLWLSSFSISVTSIVVWQMSRSGSTGLALMSYLLSSTSRRNPLRLTLDLRDDTALSQGELVGPGPLDIRKVFPPRPTWH